MATYSTTFAGPPGTSLEDFDGWRILYADGGLTDRARISSGGSGIDALLTGSLSSWVIYAPSVANSTGSANQRITLSGISISPQHLHAMLRATGASKSGFGLRVTNATTWNVWRVDNGAFTSLGSGSLSPALSTSDGFEFAVDGSALTLTRNGSPLLSYASATQYQAHTDVGIPVRGTADNAEIIGSWESADIGGGGTAYNETIAEAVTASDVILALASVAASLTEAAVLADSATNAATIAAALSEAVAASDALTTSASYAAALSEVLTLADAAINGNTYAVALSESLTLSDGLAQAVVFAPTITEALSVAESLASQADYAGTLAEVVSMADALTADGGANIAFLGRVFVSTALPESFTSTALPERWEAVAVPQRWTSTAR